MDTYITGTVIRRLRESSGLTQAELGERIGVSSKTVSKWETAKGLPDISLIEPLASALGVSVLELMSGSTVTNRNTSSNLLRSGFYVCPLCGNVIHSMGEAVVCCCGITLPRLEAEEISDGHEVEIQQVEDEYFLTIRHDMTKNHYISFAALVTTDRMQLIKFYPEGNAETRLPRCRRGTLYFYCNRHGLMKSKFPL